MKELAEPAQDTIAQGLTSLIAFVDLRPTGIGGQDSANCPEGENYLD
ncbi:MAG: hypothetical protein K1X74_07710 [Pirellulales bacterium]|nr:hypothetical protein [Pirellulales bacterium]